jgi:competence protein ComEA
MKNWLMSIFSFSKREYNGLLFLLFITLAVSIFPYLYEHFYDNDQPPNEAEKIALQQLVLADRYDRKSKQDVRNEIENSSTPKATSYFPFDPNLIDEKQWQQLGLSYKQALSIVNYVKKGGRFRQPTDLKKMYTLSERKYEELLPYVTISQPEKTEKKPFTFPQKERIIVEINLADSIQLYQIRGIGPAFARRIIKYRERLGGFTHKEQLFQVYGIDSAKFDEIKDQIAIDVSAIRKININTAEFDDLRNHPYLRYKELNAIIQYRRQHGPYKSIADLNKVLILTPETIQNISPYLSF